MPLLGLKWWGQLLIWDHLFKLHSWEHGISAFCLLANYTLRCSPLPFILLKMKWVLSFYEWIGFMCKYCFQRLTILDWFSKTNIKLVNIPSIVFLKYTPDDLYLPLPPIVSASSASPDTQACCPSQFLPIFLHITLHWITHSFLGSPHSPLRLHSGSFFSSLYLTITQLPNPSLQFQLRHPVL